MIISACILTVLCAFLYRVGGASWGHTKWRDLGIPLLCVPWMMGYCHAPWYGYLIAFVGMFAGLTTYFDSVSPTGEDDFFLHGFVIGISCVFIGDIWMAIIRAIIIAFFMHYWCKIFKNDWVEELGRGAIIAATLPLLTIGG